MALLIWGGVYLGRCLNAVVPTGSLDISFATPNGPVRLKSESVAFNFWKRELVARSSVLYSPTGEVIAKAAIVEVQIPKDKKRSYDFQVTGLRASLIRLPNGKWKHLDLIPEQKEKSKPIPFSIAIKNAQVVLVDQTSASPTPISVHVDSAQLDGLGDRWVTSAKGTVGGKGSFDGMVRLLPQGGIGFRFKVANLDVAKPLSIIKTNREGHQIASVKDLQAESVRVSGLVSGHYSKQSKVDFSYDGTTFVDGFTYRDINVSHGTWTGHIGRRGAVGHLEALSGQARATLDGAFDWRDSFRMSGAIKADHLSSSSLPRWAKKYLPQQMTIQDSSVKGWLTYENPKSYSLNGDIRVGVFEWTKERIDRSTASLHLLPHQIRISQLNGTWMGSPIRGEFQLDLLQKKITAFGVAESLPLDKASQRFNGPKIKGFVNAQAIVSGTTQHPVVDVRATGSAIGGVYQSRKVSMGLVEFAGRYSDGDLRIERFATAGSNGVFVASGKYNINSKKIDISVDGNGIDLSAFNDQLVGTAIVRAHIKGTPDNPVASGRAEVVGSEILEQSLPFAAGDVHWDKNGVFIRNLTLVKGATRATGYLAWTSNDQQLDGELKVQDVILKDWVGDSASGTLTIRGASISGTLANPMARFHGVGTSLVVSGVRIDQANFAAAITRNRLFLRSLRLKSGTGTATAEGYIDLSPSQGEITGQAKGIPLGRFLTLVPDNIVLDGTLDGKFEARLHGAQLTSLTSSGNADNISVNGVFFGSGSWGIAKQGQDWLASMMIGQIERFIEIPSLRYNPERRTIDGSVTAFRVSLKNVIESVKRYLPADSGELQTRLDTLSGDLDLNATIQGSVDDPVLNISLAQLSAIQLAGQDLGTLELSTTRENHKWVVNKCNWLLKEDKVLGQASISGTIDEKGEIALSGDNGLISRDVIRRIVPQAEVPAEIGDISVTVKGPTRSPLVRASAEIRSPNHKGQSVNLDTIEIKDGSIDVMGRFSYDGIEGSLKAFVPFRYPLQIVKDEPFSLQATLTTPDLSRFMQFAPWLDSKKTDGTINGYVGMSGTIEKPEVSGKIVVAAPHVKLEQFDTSIRNLQAQAIWEGKDVSLTVAGESAKGGDFSASGSVENLDPVQLISNFEQALSCRVSGNYKITNLYASHDAGKNGAIGLRTTGEGKLAGTLRSPLITGNLDFSDVSGTAPTVFATSEEKPSPTINPRFDINFDVAPGAKAKASTAEVIVLGSGTVTGNLYRPNVQSNFTVLKGQLKLPNARITVDEGGTLRFSYQIAQDGAPDTRLDVSMSGRTSISALRFGTTLERYTINLQMQGNILKEGDMKMLAQSEPPDLSQERILAILGQGDLFLGLSHGEEKTIATYAIPTIFDPIGQKIAQGLGLEYLNVEYDLFQRTTITAARALGGGFTLMGSRQLTPSTFGKELYEIRLNYRLPFRNKTLRSFMIGAGMDQDRPWKFSIEYGRRF